MRQPVRDATHEYVPKGNQYLYLFPDEPAMGNYKNECRKFGLEFVGKNYYQGERNLVIRGSLSNLKKYAEYLIYDLHPDYLYREREFAGQITDTIEEEVEEEVEDSINDLTPYEINIIKFADKRLSENDADSSDGYLTNAEHRKIKEIIQTNNLSEEEFRRLAPTISKKYGYKYLLKDSVKDKLIKVPDNIKKEFEKVLTSGNLFKIVSQHPMYLGDTHYQIITNKQYDKNTWKKPVDFLISKIEAFEDKYHEPGSRHSDVPVTWNFGLQKDGYVSAGVDIDKMWVEDSVEDSYYSENDKKDKVFVKNALEEMRRYVRNWNYMSSQDKRNVGCSLQELQKRIKELEAVQDSEVKDAKEPLLIRYKEQGANTWVNGEFDNWKQFKDWVAMSGKGTYNVWVMWIKKNGEFVFKDGPVRVSEMKEMTFDSVNDVPSMGPARQEISTRYNFTFGVDKLIALLNKAKAKPSDNLVNQVEHVSEMFLDDLSTDVFDYVYDKTTHAQLVREYEKVANLLLIFVDVLRDTEYGQNQVYRQLNNIERNAKQLSRDKKNIKVVKDSIKDSVDKNKIKNLVNSGKYPNTYYDMKKNDIQSSSAREIADIARKLGVEDKYSYEWDGYHLDLNWLKNEIKIVEDSVNTKHVKLLHVINKLNKYKDSKVKDVKWEQVQKSKLYTGETPKIFGKANEIETSEEARKHYGEPCSLYKFDNGKVALVVGETNSTLINCWLDYPQSNYTELGTGKKIQDDNKKHIVYFYD